MKSLVGWSRLSELQTRNEHGWGTWGTWGTWETWEQWKCLAFSQAFNVIFFVKLLENQRKRRKYLQFFFPGTLADF